MILVYFTSYLAPFARYCAVLIKLSILTERGASLTNSFTKTSENIAISHILLKTRFFGLHFCRQYGSTFIHHFYVIV